MATLLLCLSLLIAAVQYSTVDSALPCNSPLRQYLPQEFTHCSTRQPCRYGSWSPWTSSIPVQVRADSSCDSGKARKYERSKTSVPGTTCTPDTVKEYKYECEPTLRQKAELIIRSLRLGVDADGDQSTTRPTLRVTTPPATRVTNPPKTRIVANQLPPTAAYITCSDGTKIPAGQTCPPVRFTTARPPISTIPRPTLPIFPPFSPFRGKRQAFVSYCPTASRQANNRICPNICPSRGKRSFEEEDEFAMAGTLELQRLDEGVPVEPFNMEERVNAIHERRRRQACPSGTRHVLFIVDTSGSIGRTTFNKVRDLLASISEKLCDRLRVAMMTYSDDINLEFCFNCYTDRREIFTAIQRVQYRGGATHTTDATKCACQTMLTTGCGLHNGRYTPNIDIVYLTDGKHNGPCRRNLNSELQCFHRRSNINTYAIAIGNAALASVQAIENPRDSGDSHIFNVDDFDDLQKVFRLILQILNTRDSNGEPVYTCFSHNKACGK